MVGSSPLARGLRAGAFLARPPVGIIPARAGFTGGGGLRRGRDGDHPRSRGVYSLVPPGSTSVAGPSPLALGVPAASASATAPAGSIPARAGFTRDHRGRAHGGRDHPRSRGVYARREVVRALYAGSSPLARGLPYARPAGLISSRIIPARAGFTGWEKNSEETSDGSSPLARGLQGHHALQQGHVRIIPARAGFTLSTSRSPAVRIIPARAGFTGNPSRPPGAASDHPRSRGVYRRAPATSAMSRGSSPLARGLLARHVSAPMIERIIPARAGFTRSPMSWAAAARDHPRSRGVYLIFSCAPARMPGSSPLARGLRQGLRGPGGQRGIIPARAGFTVGGR